MSKKITRRTMFQQAMALGVGGLATQTFAPAMAEQHQEDAELTTAALAGVAYFRKRNEKQLEMVNALQKAIASRDLETARAAYVDARPPYEEIETLAGNFEDSDADIDARPYAFDGGEMNEDFCGYHKIEYLLFRDDDLDLAGQYAEQLAASVRKLHGELEDLERYKAATHFEGMIALAEEIGSKKISSEEETWSDQSMLIFRSNILGVYSQYKPFSSIVAEKAEARDAEVQAAFEAFQALLEPHRIGPGEALTPYSKVGIAERKGICAATYRLRDSLIAVADTLGVFAS